MSSRLTVHDYAGTDVCQTHKSPDCPRIGPHVLADAHPRPSGWRAYCTCGWSTAHVASRAQVSDLFHEHCEQAHMTIGEDK